MSEQENVFLYTIHPKRAVTGLTNIGTVRTAKSLFLTKEDVYIALKGASVYRRFANIGKNERVNIGNVDRLHRAEYISEEDWAKMQVDEAAKGNREVAAPVVEKEPEPTKVEPPVVEPEPVKVEEPVEAEPVVEEVVVEDTADVEDDLVVEEVADEDDEEEVLDEDTSDDYQKRHNNHNNKKKHKR